MRIVCRKSWEYQMMRRVLFTAAAIATLGCAAIFVVCEFDDARSLAVLKSIPRTLGAAGACSSPTYGIVGIVQSAVLKYAVESSFLLHPLRAFLDCVITFLFWPRLLLVRDAKQST